MTRKPMRMTPWILPPTILLLALALIGCDSAPPAEEALRPVRTQLVEPGVPDAERRLPGRLEAGANRRLSFRLDGQLDAFEVSVGERVAAGQPLARLDSTDITLQRDQAQAGLASAAATAANAEAEWQRARRLYEAGSAPARQLDAARAQVESARAQQRSAERQLALAERQLGFAELDSPGACRVAQRLVEAGENVGAGQPVLVLACGEGMDVRAALSEDLLERVEEGDRVEVELPLLGLTLQGRVAEIGLPLQPPQATWPLRVSLEVGDDSASATLTPGMAAEIRLPQAANGADSLWVPMAAVGEDDAGHYVYVALEEDAAETDANDRPLAQIERREIGLGRRQGESLEIVAGLDAGERLVVAGMSRISDGQRVRLEANR
ncbi:efflux RND transporter periplasmic adaptor subunit [Franzmannia qiaohouensis]|uniref:Efflux RND transporter periplasmic adaptor subunit n=1 Tax=Franzmannia qiaohouensis TaxID=1329370 RepID=A0ABU1HJR0_9GAMM|nr:efflux RND transporter periplasmic adaptor subunit [Halomonas qiaohouensis]MDR5907283.1 efflux RND transporter periplasmic adaptor subunit [Halomonas qiaohouensis]